MLWISQHIYVVIGYAAILLVLVAALVTYIERVRKILQKVEDSGRAIQKLKDGKLQNLVDKIPIPADAMTGLRLGGVFYSLSLFVHDKFGWAAAVFIIALLFDLLDGLKARAEATRRGKPTPWGKYLDPCVDLICFVAIGLVMYPNFPWWLISSFLTAISMRIILSFVILFGRLIWRRWRDRIPSTVMPESIAGRFKTVFIGLSFGLVMVSQKNDSGITLAWWLLGTAIILEIISLTQQCFRAMKMVYGRPYLTVINSPRKTGSG